MYLFRAMQISAKGCVDACIHTHSLALIYMARAIHEQKESLEEAVLRMGSEQIRRCDIRRGAIYAKGKPRRGNFANGLRTDVD